MKKITLMLVLLVCASYSITAQNLLNNGDFEGGMVDWFGNAFNVQTDGGNSFNFANVEAAGNSFDVNLSQALEIVEGETYTLTFEAVTGAGETRTMIAGIGLNEAPFTADIETVTLTDELQTYELTFTASFGLMNSRVLFDMGAEVGVVVIDNVVLEGPEPMDGGDMPMVAAPTPPARDADAVFSIYSDAYTDQPNVNFGAFNVGTLDITEIEVAGDNVQQIGFVQPDPGFLLVDWGALVDNTAMTHFHMDIWIQTNLATGLVINPIWSNHVGNMGETSNFGMTNPVNTFGEWISIDVPLTAFDFGTMPGQQQRDALRQFVMTVAGADTGARTVFLDNVYLHNNTTSMGGDLVALPVDFELPAATYTFGGFEGAASSIEANPDMSGENTSATVMQTIKTEGAQFFAGTFLNIDTPIAFTEDMSAISIQTWSPKANIPVRLRLENADNSSGIELDVNTTTENAWETLTYDFSAMVDPNVDYVNLVVFFEFIPDLPGDGSTYFFDNIELAMVEDESDPVELPVDFEDDANLDYDFLGFEGAVSTLETNPDQSGINTSATVMQTIKTEGAQFFAGTFLNLDAAIPFTSDLGVLEIDTWSPKADIPVRVRLENADNSAAAEVDVNTTEVGVWETLSYDFSAVIDPSVDYVRIVVFFEFIPELPGDGSTYFFDNIELAMAEDDSDPVELPVDFEDDANLDYDFLGFEGAVSTLETNPDQSGINTSATVMQTIKTEGAQFFAGTFLNLDVPIPFSSDLGALEIDTWSPKAGIPVRVRLENADNSAAAEVDVNTTEVGAWETLNYDFSTLIDPTVDYVRIVVFFEFIPDLPGDGSTYFFDNLRVVEVLSTDEFNATTIAVYPNPTTNTWIVSNPSQNITSVEVFNISGQRVSMQKPNANSVTIDATRLSTGMYIATINTSEGSASVKLIKN